MRACGHPQRQLGGPERLDDANALRVTRAAPDHSPSESPSRRSPWYATAEQLLRAITSAKCSVDRVG
jgi:hypothetical protein